MLVARPRPGACEALLRCSPREYYKFNSTTRNKYADYLPKQLKN
jgi:hypothetical protein